MGKYQPSGTPVAIQQAQPHWKEEKYYHHSDFVHTASLAHQSELSIFALPPSWLQWGSIHSAQSLWPVTDWKEINIWTEELMHDYQTRTINVLCIIQIVQQTWIYII